MKNREHTDQELIGSYLNGNQSGLELLILRHQRKVFGYILMVVRDRELAEDIFQDTFFKVVNKLKEGSYNEEGKFLQWVMRIAHNLTIDHFRRNKRMPTYSGNEDFDIFDTICDQDYNIEQTLIRDQIHTDVVALVELLPKEQSEVLKMRIYSDMSFKEIAEITNVSINTALGRMRYALINLRKHIQEKQLIITED